MASAPMAAAPRRRCRSAPPPLERSLFARDPNGQLTEDALQKILAAPIELDLPARVGVLPIVTRDRLARPRPGLDRVPAGVAPLVKTLRKDAAFSLVTQTMVIPSGALGMEALREIAARYRLRYVMLYREVLAKDTALNAVGVGLRDGRRRAVPARQAARRSTATSRPACSTSRPASSCSPRAARSPRRSARTSGTQQDKLDEARVERGRRSSRPISRTTCSPICAGSRPPRSPRTCSAAASRRGPGLVPRASRVPLQGAPLDGPTIATDAKN